jgi:hypothetical protein
MSDIVKQDQIVFLEGKEIALKKLFSTSNFGYLAIGSSETTDNGFYNPPSTDPSDNGFHEISQINDDATYMRIPLVPLGATQIDKDTGKVLVKFSADLDIDNIQSDININQFAIVDSADVDSPTNIYAAATFSNIPKNNELAITFIIGFRY